MTTTKLLLFASLFALAGGCSSVNVRPVQATKTPIKLVYIQTNNRVQVPDLLGVIEDGLQNHGIETKILNGESAPDSAIVLTYTATRGWDINPYIKFVEIRLRQGTKLLGSASYHNGGGFDFSKWGSAESKVGPIIDQLLDGVPGS